MHQYKWFVRGNGWRILLDETTCGPDLIKQIEEFVANEKALEHWEIIKSHGNSRVWKFDADSKSYVFKEYRKREPFDYLKASIKGSRAHNALKGGLHLIRQGFETPGMPILGEKRFLGVPLNNFLVTDFVSDAIGLYTFLKDDFKIPVGSEKMRIKHTILYALGETVGKLHAAGIVHGDLRLDNILMRRNNGNKHKFYLIDNERNRYSESIPEKGVIKNLVQVNMISRALISGSDRMRFFNAYLLNNRGLSKNKKAIAKKVWDVTVKRLRKRRG
jgi:tRNA A-37 threonylcarbamoyl transferase component Bud32